jgi:uncharacterized damage-inducible protein DinB
MQVTDMTKLYAYNRWANQRLIAAAKRLTVEQFLAPSAFPKGSLRNTLGHVIRNEWAWCALLRGESFDTPPSLSNEELPTVNVVEARWSEVQAETEAYIAGLHDVDLARVVPDLALAIGLESDVTLTAWEVLMHLYTHSTQHRSEVAQMLTDHGCSPGDIDYLDFALEQPIP